MCTHCLQCTTVHPHKFAVFFRNLFLTVLLSFQLVMENLTASVSSDGITVKALQHPLPQQSAQMLQMQLEQQRPIVEMQSQRQRQIVEMHSQRQPAHQMIQMQSQQQPAYQMMQIQSSEIVDHNDETEDGVLIQNDDGTFSFQDQNSSQSVVVNSSMDMNTGMLTAILDGNAKLLMRMEYSIGLQEQILAALLSKNNVGPNNIALDGDASPLNAPEFDLIDTMDDIHAFETKLSDRVFYQAMVSYFLAIFHCIFSLIASIFSHSLLSTTSS